MSDFERDCPYHPGIVIDERGCPVCAYDERTDRWTDWGEGG